MTETNSSFRYVEYRGDDAADVLVTLLMNLRHADAEGEREVHDGGSETARHAEPERIVGFQPNPEEEHDERHPER